MEEKLDTFCANCGAELAESAKFCGKCGEPAHDGVVQSAGNPSELPANTKLPTFKYDEPKRHSKIITHSKRGIPIVEFQDLHPNAVWLFFFSFLGKTAILIPLFAITIYIEPLITGILVTSYLVILFLIGKLFYKNYKFEVTEFAFEKEFGILHKKNVSIPFDMIQNVNVRRTIIDQILGLAHIDIETAGESGLNGKTKGSYGGLYGPAEGYIPGVSPQEAIDIRELMLARVHETK